MKRVYERRRHPADLLNRGFTDFQWLLLWTYPDISGRGSKNRNGGGGEKGTREKRREGGKIRKGKQGEEKPSPQPYIWCAWILPGKYISPWCFGSLETKALHSAEEDGTAGEDHGTLKEKQKQAAAQLEAKCVSARLLLRKGRALDR